MNFTEKSFDLLKGLKKDNSKTWFDVHRDEVREHLQEPFAEMLEAATLRLRRSMFPVQGGKQTMFRMNRDVRFSKNKSPYNTYVSGLLTESGIKSVEAAVVYAQLSESGGFIAAGFHQLETKVVNLIRDQIIVQPKRFSKIAKKLDKVGYEFMSEERLKSMPRGYSDQREHSLAEYIKLKSFTLHKPQPKAAWLSGSIVDEIAKLSKAATDLIIFGTEAIETGRKSSNRKSV